MQAVNQTRHTTLADFVRVAADPITRSVGLMGVPFLPDGHALFIVNAEEGEMSIWMLGMLISIDVVFINSSGRATGIYEDVPPVSPLDVNTWRTYDGYGSSVLELPAGVVAKTGTKFGDTIQFDD